MEYEMSSKVYSTTTTVEDDHKLYELTTRMKLQATRLIAVGRDHDIYIADTSVDLAETVLEFLKVSGWSRS